MKGEGGGEVIVIDILAKIASEEAILLCDMKSNDVY